MSTRIGTASWALAAVLLLAASLGAGQSLLLRMDPELELQSLQGHWEGRGPGGDCSVTISGNSLLYRQGEDSWFETTFTLPVGTMPRQLHATVIAESAIDRPTIGTVVVAIYEVENGTLKLGVIEDFDGPPPGPVEGSWDTATDRYDLERVPEG